MLIGLVVLASLLLLGFVYEQVSRRRDGRRLPAGEMIDVGGYRLHLTDAGHGGPTVIIIHGAGDCSYSWMHIRLYGLEYLIIQAALICYTTLPAAF